VEETTFVDVTLWGRTAEVASEYLSKGSPALIEGRLKLDTWEGNDGQKRSKLKVVCERMQMLGSRGSGGSGGEGGARAAPRRDAAVSHTPPAQDEFDAPPMEPPAEDIPF
jgi:single-strand DNA-binding protein